MKRVAVTTNWCTCSPPSFLLPQHVCLLTFLLLFPFCFKRGRVNLLILQAASLSIYLSSCFFLPFSLFLSDKTVLSGSSRALGLSGVMDDYQPSAVFHYAPGRFTGSLTTRHENQSLCLILPSLPPSMPASLLQSCSLYFSIFSVNKKASIIEGCVQNNIEICVWTEESNCSSWGLVWMCQRGIASLE